MNTKSIVTSQPDVTCDVCERRLLRGEQAELFLYAGSARTVCELCAPRAVNDGWLRESDHHPLGMPAPRPRRGRGLLARLRQASRPVDLSVPEPDAGPDRPSALEPLAEAPDALDTEPAAELRDQPEGQPYDLLRASTESARAPVRARSAGPQSGDARAGGVGPAREEDQDPALAVPSRATHDLLERAIDQFNATEYPRRISGVARSLGPPAVGVRPDEFLANMVTIVIAWDLCWYRYEVVLDHGFAETRLIAKGTEPSELAQQDRLVNAAADERGALSLCGA